VLFELIVAALATDWLRRAEKRAIKVLLGATLALEHVTSLQMNLPRFLPRTLPTLWSRLMQHLLILDGQLFYQSMSCHSSINLSYVHQFISLPGIKVRFLAKQND